MTFPKHPDIDEEKLDSILEICEKQHCKIQELKEALLAKTRRLEQAEAELAEIHLRLSCETNMRPSLEVLQRMANGIDQFDRGRFQCAVAALPHETPKLSATVGITGQLGGIGDQLDRARQRRLDNTTLRVITD